MYDLPLAVQFYPNGGEAHTGASTQAKDHRHISVVTDFLLNIGRSNPDRSPALHFGDLLPFRLRLLAIRNNSKVIGLNTRECLPIAAIVSVHPLLFGALQIRVVCSSRFAACLSFRQTGQK